ncbi:hypothetical protein [Flavobacterium sp.]|uniref:hypothetical protein n=1 Tax=Flavobacterium sp. TaxID=239 RepID=UPI00404822C1
MKLGKIEINLFEDWINIIKTELLSQGYAIENLTNDKISILYYALQKRRIEAKPRNVLVSKEFICPPDLESGLELLKTKITNGEDIRPYQSRLLKKIGIQDGLLFDWDIHHLHLGTTLEDDGFINRTGPLLYTRIDDENAYLINIENHGAWTMQELLRIIHNNWPESIENFRIKDAVSLSTSFSDDDLKGLRNANVNSLIEVEPGAIYMGPGWGFVGSGDSGKAVMDHIDNRKAFMHLEKQLKNDTLQFLSPVFKDFSFITNPDLNFKLEKQGDMFLLNELNNDFQVYLSR